MSGRRFQQQLAWPVWLVLRARDDDPPTALESSSRMLRRLQRAGVTDLPPARAAGETESPGTSVVLDHGEAWEATAVATVGPGFGFSESFGDEPAPVAAALERVCLFVERWDQLRRLRLAAADMELVATTARALLDEDGPARLYERPLETAVVVIYARHYLESSSAGVGRRWWPTEGDDMQLHQWLVDELRHPYHAHADRTPHRTLVDTTAMLGLAGELPPVYAEASTRLGAHRLERIADLAERQQARLGAAADELGVQLGERRDAADDGWNV